MYNHSAFGMRGGICVPEGRLYRSMLLDFYGDLLTTRQRECFDLHFNEDLSLAEIAEACGISRQGAWDNIRRATDSLEEIEEKTGLIRRFAETREKLAELYDTLETMRTLAETIGSEKLNNLVQRAVSQIQALLKTEEEEYGV